MTTPDPLVPAEVDLRDFAFMPLDVQRLRDSDLASEETPEACWAAVLLWCASWHQVPAASIPNSDQWMAKHTGYVTRGRIDAQWARIKDGALRGWIECTDGRLYHPVVAVKALDAWRSKLVQRWKTECSRIKKHNQRHEMSLQLPEFDTWMSLGCPQGQPLPVPGDTPTMSLGSPRETHSKGQGEGQGQGQGEVKEKTSSSSSPGPTKAAPTVPCPYEAIVEAYHTALPSLPKVKLMKPARQKAMRTLWGWVLSSRKSDGERRATTAEEALAWLRSYFGHASRNDFLMGRTARSPEHAGWRCDLDFLLSDKGMKQVIEKTVEQAA